MKKLRSTLGLALALLMIVSLVACGGGGGSTPAAPETGAPTTPETPAPPTAEQFTLRVGTVLPEGDPVYLGLTAFAENVAERTNGAVEVQVFPNAQLGGDEDVIEQARVGANVGIITDPGRISAYVPDFGIFGAPYLVDSFDEMLQLLDTAAFGELAAELEEHDLKILSFNFFQGTRHLFTRNPVSEPGDLSGQRVRSSGSPVVTRTVETMGANAVVLPWAESYQALQQNVIEGVEVHFSAAIGASIPEVTDYLSLTGHFYLLTGLVISRDWFDSLPAEFQTILLEEAFNAGIVASQAVLDLEAEHLETLLAQGLTLVDVDIDAFRTATDEVFDELGFRELKDAIDSELGR